MVQSIVKKIDSVGSAYFDDLLGIMYHRAVVSLYHTVSTFDDLEKEAFLKHCGKRRKYW